MNIPVQVEYILKKLNTAGFEGYLVGGCVRDYLLGIAPYDFDITTDATPAEIMSVFSDDNVVPTGIKHGTVTVIHDGQSFEITTYRTETSYSDGRHPDSVEFSNNLADDLCRRDFTVNAMAMAPSGDIVDLYGGRQDLKQRIIRAVGEPSLRFTEDALRILRAFRFASKLDFGIEESTLAAATELAPRLALVSRERIFAELEKLLCGRAAGRVLSIMIRARVFDSIFDAPALNENALPAFDLLPMRADIRLAALLAGDSRAAEHIRSLKSSNEFYEHTTRIIECELPILPALPLLRRCIFNFGVAASLDRALINGDGGMYDAISKTYENEDCFSIADLKVNGNDIKRLTSLSGREVGEKLREVLFAVFDEKIPNTREAEIDLIKS